MKTPSLEYMLDIAKVIDYQLQKRKVRLILAVPPCSFCTRLLSTAMLVTVSGVGCQRHRSRETNGAF